MTTALNPMDPAIQRALAELGGMAEPALTEAETATVRPEPNSELEQLAASYDIAREAKKRATAALDAITDAIKDQLVAAHPGKRAVDLVHDSLDRPLRVIAVTSRRFDGEALKKADPITYVAYLKAPSTSYTLRQVGQQ